MKLLEFINLNNLNNLDLIAKGGPVMFILLGFSIFAFAIIFIKLIQFFSAALSHTNKIEKILSKLNGSNSRKLLVEIQKIKKYFKTPIYLIVGLINDKTAEKYKRKPIFDETNRKKILLSCKYVDDVVLMDTLIIDENFINKYNNLKDDILKSKYIWFSHGHPDHLNPDSLHLYKNNNILAYLGNVSN